MASCRSCNARKEDRLPGEAGLRLHRQPRAPHSSLWLVATALWTAFRRLGPGLVGDARLAFGLALTAILVHCVFYNALFEDPLFWGLLALVVVWWRADRPEPVPEAAPA